VAAKLGTPIWDRKGKFVKIDTTDQGAAYDQLTTIQGLANTLGADATIAATPTVDETALAGYYQQLADQRGLELAVLTAQGLATAGMTPYSSYQARPFGAYQVLPYAGSFAAGGIVPGPIGQPAAAIVHGGEKITTPDVNNNVKVMLEDHRTRVFVDDVEYAMNMVNRRMSRTVARRLPGGGGGLYK
jgi:hypothetical protein